MQIFGEFHQANNFSSFVQFYVSLKQISLKLKAQANIALFTTVRSLALQLLTELSKECKTSFETSLPLETY